VSLTLVQGYADRIPGEDSSFDHVVSSLALHHVDDDGRIAFARDSLRALRPGGRVTVVDFGGPAANAEESHDHGHGRAHVLRHLGGLVRSKAGQKQAVTRHSGDGVVSLLVGAGFRDARKIEHVDHRFGRMTFVQATRS